MSKEQDALKLALEALESVTGHFTRTPSTLRDSEVRGEAHKAITAIRAALAHAPTEREQPAPVAEPHKQQEPVACAAPMACSGADKCVFRTSPPANANAGKPWVGLTDEDLQCFDADAVNTARYWEAKLRERNEHREKNT